MTLSANRRRFLQISGLGLAGITFTEPPRISAASLSDASQRLLSGLTWFKQSGFRLKVEGKSIYFDPYQLSETTHDADILLITHSHNDHCDTSSVSKIAKTGTIAITEPESAAKIKSLVSDIRTVAPGDTITLDGIRIDAVASYNINKTNHPKSKNYLGFVVTLPDGRRFYQAGDTDKIPEMTEIHTDVALLPCGGTYTMTAAEAAEAAQVIQPKIVVPMHYGSAAGSVRDAQKVQELLAGIIEVVIFDPGQTIEAPPTAIRTWISI